MNQLEVRRNPVTKLKSFSEMKGDVKLIVDPRDPKIMPIRLNRLLSFIAHYQENHSGSSPTVSTMANELDVTDQVIRLYLNYLEQDGRIHRYGQNPIRIMVRDKPREIEEARRIDDIVMGKKPKGWVTTTPEQRFTSAEERRMRLARFIGEFWQQHDRAPNYAEMKQAVGTQSDGTVVYMLHALAKKGIVSPLSGKGRAPSMRLTDNGKIALGLAPKYAPAPTPAPPAKKVVVVEGGETRVVRLARFIEQYRREHHGRSPSYREMMKATDATFAGSVQTCIKKLVKKGWVEDAFPGKGKTPTIRLSDKGRKELGLNTPVIKEEEKKVRKPRQGKYDHCGRKRPMERASEVALAIHEYTEQFGFPPETKHIAARIGFKSQSAVGQIVKAMVKEGWLHHEENRHGDYRLTEKGKDALLPKKEEHPLAAMTQADEELEAQSPGFMTEPPVPPAPAVEEDGFITDEANWRNAVRDEQKRGSPTLRRHGAEVSPFVKEEPNSMLQLAKQRIVELETRLREAERRAEAVTMGPSMSMAEMAMALIEAGYIVRKP